MNPTYSNPSEKNGVFKFTIAVMNVSLANALRRTILNDIPTIVFDAEVYDEQKCKIYANTSRFHNEIIKHRLSNIPIHSKDFKSHRVIQLFVPSSNSALNAVPG